MGDDGLSLVLPVNFRRYVVKRRRKPGGPILTQSIDLSLDSNHPVDAQRETSPPWDREIRRGRYGLNGELWASWRRECSLRRIGALRNGKILPGMAVALSSVDEWSIRKLDKNVAMSRAAPACAHAQYCV